ncbi:Uncharacterised protein [Mycobacteroides abscessus subsp. abscessus]|nr:Uncharacterised protein [Mycobacteroides abscessus subsp. abscessus]
MPSDRPYPSTIGTPKRVSNRAMSSAGMGAAPQIARRSEEVSGRTSAGWATSMA